MDRARRDKNAIQEKRRAARESLRKAREGGVARTDQHEVRLFVFPFFD